MRTRFVLAMALALGSAAAPAVDSTQWPPPPEVLEHMKALQARIADPGTSKEERAAARAQLERLMKSPAGADKKTADEARKPARAAIEPFPSVVKPRTAQPERFGPPPPTAHVEVIDPPRKPVVVDPQTGSLIQPTAPGVAVDSRTGHILQETPGAYIDPRTGRIIPK